MAAVKILVWFITILVLVFLVGFRDMIKTGNCLIIVIYLEAQVAKSIKSMSMTKDSISLL